MLGTIRRMIPRATRKYVRRKLQCWELRGNDVECIVCGYRGKHFADNDWHVRAVCPDCRSDIRHRLVIASLKLLPEQSVGRIVAGKRVIHFAPERMLREYFQRNAGKYVTADLVRDDVDLRVDMTSIPSVASQTFDCCIACDVLEHVASDLDALRELYRILTPGGVAIITVPQKDHTSTTYEDATITSPEARTDAYGQFDHVRMYGDDVVDRMTNAGFRLATIDERSFSPADVSRYVLFPPKLSPRPLATNYRKVYFCNRD
jgi:SAM-dependent methyltransferase